MLVNIESNARRYVRIVSDLLEEIGGLQPGDEVASERQLATRYGVSRMTARRALQELARMSVIRRQPGRGNVVQSHKVTQSLAQLTSFTQDMRNLHLVPSTRVLEVQSIVPGPDISRLLQLSANEPVLLLRRLRLANDEPMCLEVNHLPLVRLPGIERTDLSQSLYELFRRQYGREPRTAEETIEATLAPAKEAEILRIPEHDPLLLITRLTFDSTAMPLEYVRSYYRADRYRFRVTMEPPAARAT